MKRRLGHQWHVSRGLIPTKLGFVQYRPQCLKQGLRGIRFRQEVFDPATGHLGSAAVRIQPTRRNDFHRRIDSHQRLNRGRTVHDRHHHIGEYDGDFILVLNVNGQGVRSIRRCNDPVTECLQCLAGDDKN